MKGFHYLLYKSSAGFVAVSVWKKQKNQQGVRDCNIRATFRRHFHVLISKDSKSNKVVLKVDKVLSWNPPKQKNLTNWGANWFPRPIFPGRGNLLSRGPKSPRLGSGQTVWLDSLKNNDDESH